MGTESQAQFDQEEGEEDVLGGPQDRAGFGECPVVGLDTEHDRVDDDQPEGCGIEPVCADYPLTPARQALPDGSRDLVHADTLPCGWLRPADSLICGVRPGPADHPVFAAVIRSWAEDGYGNRYAGKPLAARRRLRERVGMTF
ncbi:hypothetical protein GCM10027280_54200 [Micromonospora polyrhachis]